jgi:hypothetical protein
MRAAMLRTACSSRLGAALVLAPPATAMRDAVACAALRGCRLQAARVLTPFAPAVRLAMGRASTSTNSLLGTTLLLTRPLAHGTPPGSLHVPPNPQLNATRHSQPSPTPSQSSTLRECTLDIIHGHHAHDGGSARAGQTLGSVSRSRWSRALGRGTYGGCVVGEDGQELLRTLHRQVHRLLARRAASP